MKRAAKTTATPTKVKPMNGCSTAMKTMKEIRPTVKVIADGPNACVLE